MAQRRSTRGVKFNKQKLKTTPSSQGEESLDDSEFELQTRSVRFEQSEKGISMSRKQLNSVRNNHNLGVYYSATNLQRGNREEENVVALLQEKCGNYERTLSKLYEQKDECSQELESAREQIVRLRNVYENKLGEVSSVSNEITSRIEKQKMEKNLYIKQINNRNIEIKTLRESYSVLKSQNETLSLVLKEKQSQIEQLQNALAQADSHRHRLQNYQLIMNGSNSLMRQIEEQVRVSEKNSQQKDRVIEQLKNQITSLTERHKMSEQKAELIGNEMKSLQNQRVKISEQLNYCQAQSQQWKLKYIEAQRQIQQVREVEIKLKNAILTNEDLQGRIRQLIQQQQQYKIQMSSQSVRERKLGQVQMANGQLVRSLREKEEQIRRYEERISQLGEKLKQYVGMEGNSDSLARELEQRQRQVKSLQRKLEEKSIMNVCQQRELKRLGSQNQKMKQRNEKIDQVFKENKRLVGNLMDKINQIQKLQHNVHSLQSRIQALTNDKNKLQLLYQQSNQSLSETTQVLQATQIKLQYQINFKLQLQQRYDKVVSQNQLIAKGLAKQKDLYKMVLQQKEVLKKDVQQLQQQLSQSTSRYQLYQSEYQAQINQQRRKLQELSSQITLVKRRLDNTQKKQKQHIETISMLENDKRTMVNQYATLRASYQQQCQRLSGMDQWKEGYIDFMTSINRTVREMQQTSQQLIA